jgi:hypothetical protein
VAPLDLRLRVTSPELLGLPWHTPLEEWDPTSVDLRDIPVGPSRHLVRFVHADGRLWAVKARPARSSTVLRLEEGPRRRAPCRRGAAAHR